MRPVNQRQMTLACIRLADGHSVQVENEADAYAVMARFNSLQNGMQAVNKGEMIRGEYTLVAVSAANDNDWANQEMGLPEGEDWGAK